jgi:hypothetical protein
MKENLNASTKPGAISKKIVFTILTINSLFLVLNGIFMLINPRGWFFLVPGVKLTGGFNQHFVRDIGIVQGFLGAAFIVGIIRPRVRLDLWAAATIWLIAHALFHYWEVAVGICGPSALLRDFPDVTLPALIGIVATVWAWRPERIPIAATSASSAALAQKTVSSR